MSLFVFSSILLGPTSSSTSWAISGKLLMLPPRLRLDDVEEELRPESGMGEVWHSRRKSQVPPEWKRKSLAANLAVGLKWNNQKLFWAHAQLKIGACNIVSRDDI